MHGNKKVKETKSDILHLTNSTYCKQVYVYVIVMQGVKYTARGLHATLEDNY